MLGRIVPGLCPVGVSVVNPACGVRDRGGVLENSHDPMDLYLLSPHGSAKMALNQVFL